MGRQDSLLAMNAVGATDLMSAVGLSGHQWRVESTQLKRERLEKVDLV